MLFKKRAVWCCRDKAIRRLIVLFMGLFVLTACSEDCPECPVLPEPAVDNLAVPYIAYLDQGNWHLMCAKRIGDAWGIKTVDAGPIKEFISLAIGPRGNPHITYYDNQLNLKYAAQTENGEWEIKIVDTNVIYDRSIAVDPKGNVHIAYFHNTYGYMLKYAKKTGDSWSFDEIATSCGTIPMTSIAVDASGTPHIVWYHQSATELRYAVYTGTGETGWERSIIDSDGNVGANCSIAIDLHGNPHVSYWDAGNNRVKYSWLDGDSWNIEMLPQNAAGGHHQQQTSIALDKDSNPHISYFVNSSEDLGYATKRDGSWDYYLVDTGNTVGAFSCLALDRRGVPHVSYWDATHNHLKYAVKVDNFWSIEVVDPWGARGSYTSIGISWH